MNLKSSLKSLLVILLLSNPVYAAVHFDGVDDYVECGNPTINFHNTTAILLSAWVYLDSAPGSGSEAEFEIMRKSESTDTYLMDIANADPVGTPDENYLEMCIDTDSIDCVADTINPRFFIPLNEWHHVAATYDGGAMKVWVDGVVAQSESESGNIDDNSGDDLCIGIDGTDTGGACNTSRPFDGKIAEVFLGSIVPSANEMLLLASGAARIPLQAPFKDSIGLYLPMDDWPDDGVSIDGKALVDLSANRDICTAHDATDVTADILSAPGALTIP